MSVPEGRESGREPRRPLASGRAAFVSVALMAMAGCDGGEGGITWPDLPQMRCTSADTWIARGFQYEHFTEAGPDALLTATVGVGEVVPLRVTTLVTPGCEEAVQSVMWESTAPTVATLTAKTRLEADLEARQEGETEVSATAALTDGSRVKAELYAVPREGSPLLRVYTVRVVR